MKRTTFYTAAALLLLSQPVVAQGVQNCAAHDEKRTPVPIWSPDVNAKGNVSTEPPTGEGLIVFIEMAVDNDQAGCRTAPADNLYSVSRPDSDDVFSGGLAINLRGNVQFANGLCHFHGFYMNEMVMGLHQGWVETYFGAIPTKDISLSGRYCLAGK